MNPNDHRPRRRLEDLPYDVIQAHIMNPDKSPLPDLYKERFDRVIYAAKMLNNYHPSNVSGKLQTLYRISSRIAKEDVSLAQELFKSKFEFDWDFWKAWQIKDLTETIKFCKEQGRMKERIAAHKVLKSVIGERPEIDGDPKHMENNVFYVQLNNNNTTVNVPLNKIKGLSQEDIQTVVEEITAPIPETDESIEELLFGKED